MCQPSESLIWEYFVGLLGDSLETYDLANALDHLGVFSDETTPQTFQELWLRLQNVGLMRPLQRSGGASGAFNVVRLGRFLAVTFQTGLAPEDALCLN